MNERIFNISVLSVTLMGILQLALSQIQIAVITDVFATEIGFYYFLFIVFGLVMVLNSMNVKSKNNAGLLIGGTVIVLGSGIKYLSLLIADVNAENVLTFGDISVALFLTIAGLVVYVGGCILMLTLKRSALNG